MAARTEPGLSPYHDYFEFRVGQGEIENRLGDRSVMLPQETFDALVSLSASHEQSALRAIFVHLGWQMGRAVRLNLNSLEQLPLDVAAERLATVLGMHGFGTLRLETWGQVLLVRRISVPVPAELSNELFESLLTGVLRELTSDSELECVGLGGSRGFLVSSRTTAADVRGALARGQSESEIINALAESEAEDAADLVRVEIEE